MFNGKLITLVPYQQDFGSFIAKWYYSGKYDRFFRHINRPLSYGELVNFPSTINCLVMMIMHEEKIVGMITIVDYKPQSRVCKVGIMLDKDAQNKGFAPDATITVVDYIFNALNLRKIVFAIVEGDKRTEEVLKKGGLTREATLVAEVYYHGSYKSEVHYSIFKDQFNSLYKDYWRT